MEGKASDWRPGPTVCRCCLSEGCYKDISTEYFWMGKREVYEEMLTETLNISISFSKSGGPNSNSRLICEPCIARLRDATEFKRQVIDCEKTFMHHLDPGSSSSRVTVQTIGDVKVELVKREKDTSDDDFDDRPDFLDVDSDDDLDNQPLTKLASKVPKKEAVDILDLLDNSQITVKRKATLKIKEAPPKKLKKKEVVVKPSASKPAPAKKPTEKKKGRRKKKDELQKETKPKKRLFERQVNRNPQWKNAVLALKHSTAIPFKTCFNRIICSYCQEEFEPMAALREHIQSAHSNADFNSAFYKVTDGLKVDITEMQCKMCFEDIPDIETLMTHLSKNHDIPVNFDVSFGVLPYRQSSEGLWMCLYCDKTFIKFSQINEHLRSHVKIFTCDKCSATFLSVYSFRMHQRSLKCNRLNYKPRFEKKSLHHRRNTEILLQCSTACPFRTWGQNFNCIFCRVQSNDPKGLREHMAARHADFDVGQVFNRKLKKEFLKVDITDLQCKLCFMRIESIDDLMIHLKNDHKQPISTEVEPGVLPFKLKDGSCWQCAICSIQFSDFISLKNHTNEHYQNYVCDTCGEGFITETALVAHTKIPHDNKFACGRCIATFSTLEERSIHIKTQHTNLPYMCIYCKENPRFATWELRKRHLMEFHNYKPGADMYECTTCHMTFKTRSQKYHHNVKAHRSKKEAEYSYQCGNCARAFASKMSLDRHIARKH